MPAFYLAFQVGDTVCHRDDPRHLGRVRAVFYGMTIRVEWDETQWLSDLPADKLEKTTRD